ncbi:MAG: multidrug effflux MFS transporter [Pseudomonadota bacterium]
MSTGMMRSAVVLGLLACVGPLSIDMYLPALPAIAGGLETSVGAVQMTLTVFFIAFGLSQLVYGPVADQVGRKPPLYFGLSIFIIGSVGCALAPSIEILTVARFVQGLGAAVVMVIPRAIIRDLHTGVQATRLMALIMLVISVSPMLAPLVGSGMILLAGWRAIFVLLCVAALCSLLLTSMMLPETLKSENRVVFNTSSFLRGCGVLLRDMEFMGLTFIGGFGMASFFVFIASAAFVYTGQFGLTPTGFSLAFAFNAIGFFSASQLAASFGARFGMARMVSAAVAGFAFFTLLLLALTLAGYGTLYVIIGLLFLGNACLGLVIPTTMVLALENHGDMAGLASSLGGTLQMVAGGAMIALASPFFDGTATPMITAIALCGVAALILSRLKVVRTVAEPQH